jgi:hypothetical protein
LYLAVEKELWVGQTYELIDIAPFDELHLVYANNNSLA